ncbi:MAG TPA: ABC transporter ATP-binding protein [Candidatus Udaeobacter sp.]|nr:ABC transporter ATP-binding protein [Candidatus Udaeobacter sp.]
MIEVQRLTKTYGSVRAIDEVSFTVERGQVLGFLGPNGAGKTTTMRILSGFLPPTAGTAKIAGIDVVEDSLAARRRIGYLPENVPLYPEMTVSDYLRFVAAIKRLPAARARQRLPIVLDQCGLESVARTIIHKLSKGYRQRVGIAQAMIHDPEVLILDEPTVGLDPHQIIEVRQLVKSLAGSRTVILSTHILPEVEQVCDRVVILSRGRVIAEDTPANLTARLRGSRALRFVVRRAADSEVSAIRALPGVRAVRFAGDRPGVVAFEVEAEPDAELAEPLARLALERGLGLLELAPVGMSLETVFVELTTREAGGEGDESAEPRPATATLGAA